jgi:hypothetical protein
MEEMHYSEPIAPAQASNMTASLDADFHKLEEKINKELVAENKILEDDPT